MKSFRLLATVVFLCAAAQSDAIRQGHLTLDTAPPVVVETTPRAGATGVDPTLREIRVVFSKDMMTEEMWSVVKINDETFPALAGDVHYVDSRTFVIPVALEPGTTYAMWLNYKQNDAFRDTNGTPLIPYFMVFETRK